MTKVLITGSQGFIGSYLCNEFLNQGYEVIGVDNYAKYGFPLNSFLQYWHIKDISKLIKNY